MNKAQEKDQLEVLVAVGIGLAFVGWLISAHLAGWLELSELRSGGSHRSLTGRRMSPFG